MSFLRSAQRGLLLIRARPAFSVLATISESRPHSLHARPVTTSVRRVVRARRPKETSTVAQPTDLKNTEANPVIVLQNAIALQRTYAVVNAYEACRERGVLRELQPQDFAGLIRTIGIHTTKFQRYRGVEKAYEIHTELTKAGVAITAETEAAMVKVLGLKGDVSAAVRYARTALAADLGEDVRKIYDALVDVLALRERPEAAARLLHRMTEKGMKPSPENFASVIRGQAHYGTPVEAVATYERMLAAEIPPTERVISCLIDAFAKRGRISSATKYFNEIEKRNLRKGTAAYTAMIRAHAVKGNVGDAVAFYRKMREAGVEASPETYTYLIQVHGKAKDVAGASKFFYKKELVENFTPTFAMYGALIEAYTTNGQADLGWRKLGELLRRHATYVSPNVLVPLASDLVGNAPAYICDMLKLADIRASAQPPLIARLMETLVHRVEHPQPATALALYNLHGKDLPFATSTGAHVFAIAAHALNGDVAGAEKALEAMQATGHKPQTGAHTALINAFAIKGDQKGALNVYDTLKENGLKPDAATFDALFKGLGVLEEGNEVDKELVTKLAREASELGVVPVEARHRALVKAFETSGVAQAVDEL
ncbi:pentatricopeptide repeat domain-containing protein [Spizellomyces punctatus DAOM BR117]|uniref:Pentatricopeptide repeat domain-containing protein n=1 Tax=Spizellomyces punctatus (strain DAOM BR117) TaxID=645134 RepID=A0A0L0HKV7_SPIPD|nr:pentatricopeptide repeat domain-containing protein [Spizellomyces punctatus DAOM BR117]KND01678.1 pentatricopeptide repeat domain-containing protein [Spizellomyces punctatus DAOM BR117]|eukprot:XP_016609717.1 pentatricopeptide repeat domain-containing protein [Spizellomyces punctatus DAOM BR117]